MLNIKKRPRKRAAIFFIIAALVSCEKPEESIGIDLQPGDDIFQVSGVDTFTVRSFSLPEDSLRTDGVITGMVGAYIDPIFGFLKAEHYTELRLISSNPRFYSEGSSIENLIVDSLVLNLAFETTDQVPIYGSSGSQYFQVFEIDDSLDVSETYYSNQALSTVGEDLVLEGHNLIKPNYRDSSVVGELTFRPSIRIPLNPELAQRIFNASAENDGLSATRFIEEIKGLKITVDEDAAGVNLSNSGIISFNSAFGLSRMELYYRDTLSTGENAADTLSYDFEIRTNTGKFNSFRSDFSRGGDVNFVRQLQNGATESGNEKLYLQAAAGVKMFVDLPYFESLRDVEGLAIAKAELIIPANTADASRFPVPTRLLIFGLDEEGDAFLLDEFLEDPQSFSAIDGSYDPGREQYRFYLSRFLQQILTQERDFHGLEIVVQRASTTANRVILNGSEFSGETDTADQMRLEIVFTNF